MPPHSTDLSKSPHYDATYQANGLLTIDLGALCANYRFIAERAAPAQTSAVVKANAYGLGVDHVAPALYNCGCRLFFVAQLSEAIALKPMLKGDAKIAILNGVLPGNAPRTAHDGFIPVLNSRDEIVEWHQLCQQHQQSYPAIIQLDSGMARLGLDDSELQWLIANQHILSQMDIIYIISHLACADNPQSDFSNAQLQRFEQALKQLPPIPAALANSGGVFLNNDYYCDMVRPGIALYGADPAARKENPLKPVIKLETPIAQIRTVPTNTKVGYGSTYITQRSSRLATVPVGYADGLHRALSPKGAMWFENYRLPIVGRISMDSTILDITDVPENLLKRGDMIEIIGKHQTIDDLAVAENTISYEILTSLGQRYRRLYI